jgi:molybdopterin/thiamine biosynthesis adenylyltransferase
MSGPDGARWFEANPERLQWEIDRLKELGLDPEQSEDEHGRLVLAVDVPDGTGTGTVSASIVFPSEYPTLCPRVWGPPGLLKRHQNPLGNLCLVDDEGTWWLRTFPASFLIHRMIALLEADAEGTDAVLAGEADVAEPFTGHFASRPDVTVVIPEESLAMDLSAKRGTFVLGEASRTLRVMMRLEADGLEPFQMDEGLADAAGLPEQAKEIQGEWFDLDQFPESTDWREVVQRAEAAVRGGAKTTRRGSGGRRRRRGARTSWIGITFFEEGPARGQRRRAWLFFELKTGDGDSIEVVGGTAIGTQALSRRVRRQRTHQLAGLEEVGFVVVGAGSLGGPLALELVKADAGRIDLFDGDDYDINNSVRHVLPASASATNKAEAIAALARELNPFSEVVPHPWAVGTEGRSETVRELISQSAAVVDAAGSHAITRLLHGWCAEASVPLVSVGLTPGANGGRVLTLRAPTPCFDCFLAGQDQELIPQPPAAPPSNFTPYGCSHPAASGAGFDATELVAVATRRVVQAADVTEYPGPGSDWIVLSFRDYATGEHYQAGALTPHHDCEVCG